MKHTTLLKSTLAAAALLLSGVHASAQLPPSPPPLATEIEGAISAITLNGDGTVAMTVMGMNVVVPVGTPVSTPSSSLTFTQLVDPAPLPNRTEAGFIGGTAIVIGTADFAGTITAEDVFVEPAENVILGVVTANGNGTFAINNVPIVLLGDPRMPALPVRDVNGIEILQSSIPVGSGASTEGYFANGVFNAFLVEADEGTPVDTTPQITIVRADARERTPNNRRGDDLEIRGTVTMTHLPLDVSTQSVSIFRVDGTTQTLLGTITATRSVDAPTVGDWRLRMTTPPTNDPVLGTAPTTVRAVNISPGANNASATAPVNVR